MGASMEMALNSFSSEEQTLVLLASVFESQPIPEVVFKILFKSLHSSLARFSKSSELLERSNFIEVESVLGSAIWGNSRRSWSIHTMRQKYISEIKEEEIDLMFTKLCQQVQHNNIIAMLLVIYGQVPWCDKAAMKLGIPIKQFEDIDIVTGDNFSLPWIIEPFVWLLHGEPQDDRERQSHQFATEIIHKYFHSIQLHDMSMSNLLDIFVDIGVRSKTQEDVAWALQQMSQNVVENAVKIGSYPHVMERLVALLDNGVRSETQQCAAWVLGQISQNVVENAVKVGSFPHAVERLVTLLDIGVRPQTQEDACWTLGQLSQNAVENAMKIGSFPHAVERLVAFLDDGVPWETQQWAAWALGQISQNVIENAMKIGSFPHAMKRLVRLLVKDVEDYKFQMRVITCLWSISYGVGENQLLLKRVFMENSSCIEILASCATSKAQGNGLAQYFGAQVYHLLNVDNGMEKKYESSQAYEGQGDFKVRKEDYVGALGDYENGLAIDKEDLSGQLHSKRSFVKAKLGDLQGALADANEFLQIRKDRRSFGLQERGILKRLMGDLPGALADLDEGLHLKTDDYERLKHRGLVKYLLNDEGEAIADAEWALRVKPAQVDAYSYGRGACFGTKSVEYLEYKLK